MNANLAVWIRSSAAALVAAVCLAASAEERVVVLTSFPEAMTVQFERAFERAHPGMRVELLWRQSADGLAYLRDGGEREVDVYWTPAPGNFMRLRDEGRLAALVIEDDDLPGRIGGVPISDPQGRFVAFELAGFGMAYHHEAVRALGVASPRDWRDLTHPAYAGQIHVPSPGRTGFAAALIEAVLQAEGWERGWATLSAIAGNARWLGNVDEAAGPDPLALGRVAVRLSIDFFARASGEAVRFAYPPQTAYSPAHIAVLAHAPHPQAARAFVEFVLSSEGQRLLLHPDVARLPVRPSVYASVTELTARPFAEDALAYDSALTDARRGLVAALFDAALSTPHAALVEAWQLLHAAERDGTASAAVREARRLLEAAPLDQAGQADEGVRRLFARGGSAEQEAERAAAVAVWQQAAAGRIAAARNLLGAQR